MSKQTTLDYCRIIDLRKITLIVLIAICLAGYAKSYKVDSLTRQMTNIERQMQTDRQELVILQKEVEICEKSLKNIDEHVDRVNEEVSNQIALSSHTIQVWGWIISAIAILASIAGLFFARHINRMRKDISHLTSEARKQLKQAQEASDDIYETQQRTMLQQSEIKLTLKEIENQKQELQKLYSDIRNNSQMIYMSLRREETKNLLKRLEDVPEDVVTLQGSLLVRSLEDEDFETLLLAYHNLITSYANLYGIYDVEKLRETNSSFAFKESAFLLLFAQHFMDKSIVLPELRQLLRAMFTPLFQDYFFKNDADKSTKDFKKGISSLEIQEQTDLIVDYIRAICKSKYAKILEWYKILLSDLSESQLEKIWNEVSKDDTNAIYFAKTIKDVVEAVSYQSTLLKNMETYIEEAEKNTEHNQI